MVSDELFAATYNKFTASQTANSALIPYGDWGNKPLLNQNTLISPAPITVITRPSDFLTYMEWFKRTPECVSLVSCLVTDVLSDGWSFKGPQSGREKAERFLLENNASSQFEGWLYDTFILGNGFLYKGRISKAKYRELKELFMKSKAFRYKEFVSSLMNKYEDEATGARALQYVPCSTMNITSKDRYASKLIYSQRVNQYFSAFDEDEIIHLKDMNLNGELWGAPRFKAIFSEVSLLGLLKDYYGHMMDNYGVPPGMFSLPDEQPDSPNMRAIRQILEEGKKSENKNKVMALSGNIDYIAYDRLKDMEFKNLADFLTHIIAMVWQVPPSRWGGTGQRGEETVLSNQGYYRNIGHVQTKVENILNTQLFKPFFNVEFQFNRTHKEDEVRVAQAEKVMTDLAEQRMRLGLWSKEAAAEYLGIQEEDLGEIDPTDVAQSQYNQVGAGNETLQPSAKREVSRLKAPQNRSAASDIRAKGNK